MGDLYRLLKDKASGNLSTNSYGLENVGIIARVKDGTRAILVMHLGESNRESGLKFRVNAKHLIEYFGLSLEDIRASLPTGFEDMPDTKWRFRGHFAETGHIEKFMAMLASEPQRCDE